MVDQHAGSGAAPLAETLRHLGIVDHVPPPDPRFVQQTREELMHAMAQPLPRASLTPPDRHGRFAGAGTPWLAPRRPPSARPWLASLATAALVLATLVGSFVALSGTLRHGRDEAAPAIMPAPVGTPEASPLLTVTPIFPPATPAAQSPALSARQSGETVLLAGTFTTLPAQAADLTAERTILDPGAAWDLNTTRDPMPGPALFLVESGDLTVASDGPMTISRSGTETATAIAPGTAVTLHPGDRGMIPYETVSHWRNAGTIPASVLDARVTPLGLVTPPAGVSRTALIDEWPIANLTAPVTVSLQRNVLAAGDELRPATVPDLKGFYVEHGTLEVRDTGRNGTPAGAFVVPAGAARIFGGNSYPEIPPGWTVRSAGAAPVTLLLLTMTTANPLEGTPNA